MTVLSTHRISEAPAGGPAAWIREAAQAITSEAEAHGWEIRDTYRSARKSPSGAVRRARKRAVYIKLDHAEAGRLTVRVADHMPTQPIGGGKARGRMMLHIIGVPGSLRSVLQYLARPRVTEGGRP